MNVHDNANLKTPACDSERETEAQRHPSLALALLQVGDLQSLYAYYQEQLEINVRPNPINELEHEKYRKKRLADYKMILCPSTIPILALVWKESQFISEEVLNAIGMSRSFADRKPLNARAIGLSLWSESQGRRLTAFTKTEGRSLRDEYGIIESTKTTSALPSAHVYEEQQKYIQRATRLCDAAYTFGLIGKERVNNSLTRLHGTERLDGLMRSVFLFYAGLTFQTLEGCEITFGSDSAEEC